MRVLLRTQSDARLVALARAGHDRAFEVIVERYRRPLLRACRRILPEARAEDALQQALVAAWTALRRGDEVVELRPWLYRIVRNTALNQLRVAGYDLDELVDTLSASEDPEAEVERRALVRQTLAAVAALPERQRDALLRTAIEGRGQDEVARDLGLTDTALRQLVHRARVSVRAAATAVVPLPLAAWLAAAAPRAEPMAARIVELAAGGSAAGATLAKAGTVAVLAGGAVSAPTLVDEDRPAPEPPAAKAAKPPPPSEPVVAPAEAASAEPSEPAAAPAEPRAEPPRADSPRVDSSPGPARSNERRDPPPADEDRDAPLPHPPAEVDEPDAPLPAPPAQNDEPDPAPPAPPVVADDDELEDDPAPDDPPDDEPDEDSVPGDEDSEDDESDDDDSDDDDR
jgi:RNA polymerase sigma factor (sigma-70 family)